MRREEEKSKHVVVLGGWSLSHHLLGPYLSVPPPWQLIFCTPQTGLLLILKRRDQWWRSVLAWMLYPRISHQFLELFAKYALFSILTLKFLALAPHLFRPSALLASDPKLGRVKVGPLSPSSSRLALPCCIPSMPGSAIIHKADRTTPLDNACRQSTVSSIWRSTRRRSFCAPYLDASFDFNDIMLPALPTMPATRHSNALNVSIPMRQRRPYYSNTYTMDARHGNGRNTLSLFTMAHIDLVPTGPNRSSRTAHPMFVDDKRHNASRPAI